MSETGTQETDREPEDRAGLGTTLVSVWSWFVFGACVAIWIPLMCITWLVTLPFDRARWYVGYLYRKMPVVVEKLNPLWHFRVTGNLPDNPRNPYVVVSNHESFVDILLISHVPWEMKWLSKKEMFKIPVAGWLMYLSADIPLERGDRGSAGKAMQLCKKALDRRVSVMIFPEGTRSESDDMRPFKDGAFRLAIETQLPVLPLVVQGTRRALRKHDWRFGHADAQVKVLDPVPTEGLTLDDVDALRDQVQGLILAERDQLRAAAA
ncbi:MAG: 1-acyl-sn-glycerol-3-phosphate acyltransferase [Actinomycetia bacterium]|nr:1-acyl-sn-glycerol-3-phosphate acyltransferase [Actinomycetes bacterium]